MKKIISTILICMLLICIPGTAYAGSSTSAPHKSNKYTPPKIEVSAEHYDSIIEFYNSIKGIIRWHKSYSNLRYIDFTLPIFN